MPAQHGGTILLQYGPQGAQQAGDAVLLQYQAAAATRRLVGGFMAPWGRSKGLSLEIQARHVGVGRRDVERASPWGRAEALPAEDKAVAWSVATAAESGHAAPWGSYGNRLQPERLTQWSVSTPADDERSAPWGRYERQAQPESRAPWVVSRASDHERQGPWGGPLQRLVYGLAVPFRASERRDRGYLVPWAFYSRPLAPGWGVPTPPGGPIVDPETGTVTVPVLRSYIVINDVSLRRADDNTLLRTPALSLDLDAESWTYRWSASLPLSAYDAVVPDSTGQPVKLMAEINGATYMLLAESLTRDRSFGSGRLGVSGRGVAAVLDAPYAPELHFTASEDRTAQQLANEALTPGGVPLGWDVAWALTDWLVPGGVWSHQGTHISALAAIAQAAGGYLQPHPEDQTLRILPRFPSAPWAWGSVTPDFVLPAAAVSVEGIAWKRNPAYNRVFVAGQSTGVLAQVTRAGTAGDAIAPMVVDPLITHADAGRQRGTSVLAYAGSMAIVDLQLQVMPEVGLIHPGKFVRYIDSSGEGAVERLGLVRGFSMRYTLPKLRQTVTLETFDPEPV